VVVFGGTLRAYEEDRGILEIITKMYYEFDEENGPSSASVAAWLILVNGTRQEILTTGQYAGSYCQIRVCYITDQCL
jgi:hypothetical protein